MLQASIIASLILIVAGSKPEDFSCRNEKGEPVPWFIGYKLPNSTEYTTRGSQDIKNFPGIAAGVQTMFMDPDRIVPKGGPRQFTMSNKFINESRGHHLAETMRRFWDVNGGQYWMSMVYNDVMPNSDSSNPAFGFTKGMVVFNEKQGFWLLHSIPDFAPVFDYKYPESGKQFGQSYMCVTFPFSQLVDEIAIQLRIMKPQVSGSGISEMLKEKYPSLADLFHGKELHNKPTVREARLKAVDGTRYRHFAKSADYGKDIYSDENGIAKSLDRQIEVQSHRKEDMSWKTGEDLWPACDDWAHMVLDVTRSLHFTAKNDDGSFTTLKWRTYNDNSKWLVTLGKEKLNYLCIGDVNRQKDQFTRGGGMMCVMNYDLKWPYASSSAEQNTCT